MPTPMPPQRKRWVEVSPSEFAHERQGLRYLQDTIPMVAPYRVWTNFEFKDEHGNWSEVDALVLGRGRLHLVELKHYNGTLAGNETTWLRNGRPGTSPLLLARKKAKRLRGRILKELRDIAVSSRSSFAETTSWVPYIQECIFLHGTDLEVHLTDYQAADLFGYPDARNELPDIVSRLTEPPDRQVITERDGDRLAAVLAKIGISRSPLRAAGSWQLTADPLGEGDGWQDWAAIHSMDADRHARVRVFAPPPGSTSAVANAIARRVQQEFRLLRTLHHDSIVVPVDQVEDSRGEPALVFEDDPSVTPLTLLAQPLTYQQKLRSLGARGVRMRVVLLHRRLRSIPRADHLPAARFAPAGHHQGEDLPPASKDRPTKDKKEDPRAPAHLSKCVGSRNHEASLRTQARL